MAKTPKEESRQPHDLSRHGTQRRENSPAYVKGFRHGAVQGGLY